MLNILIVDDEKENRSVLKELAERLGYEAHCAEDGFQALDQCMHFFYDLILCDIKMPRMDGIEFYDNLQKYFSQLGVRPPSFVFMTAYGKLDDAVHLMKRGALHFLTKPVRKKELISIFDEVKKIKSLHSSQQSNLKAVKELDEHHLIYQSRAFAEVVSLVDKIAESSASVLFVGESGTGKEVLARRLHYKSSRGANPFVAFHAGAVPESLVESELFGYEKGAFTGAEHEKKGLIFTANRGTFFIDELSSMPSSVQSKLLRILQDKTITPLGATTAEKVDVRWVSATNMSLEDMTVKNGFREDLLYRLKVVVVDVPPLRAHAEDVRELVNYYNQYFARRDKKLPLEVLEETYSCLESYPWPGNIRELRNVVERAHALSSSGRFAADLLPRHFLKKSISNEIKFPIGSSLEQVENTLFRETLKWCDGDKMRAASILGVTPRTIYRWIERSGN